MPAALVVCSTALGVAYAALLAWADVVASVLPIAWSMRLAGAAVASGLRREVCNLFITLGTLAVVTYFRRTRAHKIGTYVCLVGLTYGPARVLLEFVRSERVRTPSLWGLSLSQWGFSFATLLAVVLLVRLRLPPPLLEPESR